MLTRIWMLILVLIAISALSVTAGPNPETSQTASADQTTASQPTGDASVDKNQKPLTGHIENAAVTSHEVSIEGKRIPYQATAACLPMKDEHDKLKATVFFVAYEKLAAGEGGNSDTTSKTTASSKSPTTTQATDKSVRKTAAQNDPAARPITFVFNGGPGAAAVWLHMGTAGPRRIDFDDVGLPPSPPYRLVDNEHSWLDMTDLVFIDPVGTGYSRPAEGEEGKQFYGVKEDITWVADFIRLYVTEYERWLSPKFLAGESYGTTRAAGLSEHLLDRYGLAMNGIALISTVLDFQTLQVNESNDLPYMLYLPTYTAIACYHHRLDDELQADMDATLREVQAWAMNTYSVALAKGAALPSGQRAEIVAKLARYTALPADLIDKADLRIQPWLFRKHLLANEKKVVGRFDGRITGFDPEMISNWPTYDPSLPGYFAAYSTTFNDYVRRTLKYENLLPYEVLSDKVHPWNFGTDGSKGYLSVTDNLRSAMVKNPTLKVLFASGYFDLATPYFATTYTMNRMVLDDGLRTNMTHTFYRGGHMMYHHTASHAKLKRDIANLIRSALAKPDRHP